MILFFDTETTGVRRDAHLVQLCAALTDDNLEIRGEVTLLVQCAIPIPLEAQRIHGKSDELCKRFGVNPRAAVTAFHALAKSAKTFVAHNLAYDDGIMENAYKRAGAEIALPWRAGGVNQVCTMRVATDDLRIPNPNPKFGPYKWPKLAECIARYYPDDSMTKAHDAQGDVRDCMKVYRYLREHGLC